MKIWRVNTSSQSLSIEEVPESYRHLGGRGLIAAIMLAEVKPECDPLGPDNVLIYAPGLLVGHRLSSCDRLSIGTKSPLTGGIKEANAGGRTGYQLAALGIKALIIEGHPQDSGLWVLHLSKEKAEFYPANDLKGKGVYESARALLDKFGKDRAIALIGPGGEMQLTSSGILNLDKDEIPSRISARGGVGAVMAARGLKAIVIDASEGESPPIENRKAFIEAQKEFTKALIAHPQTSTYSDYGTAAMTMMADGFGAIPTKNFSSGVYENAEKISGEALRDTILQRGGKSDPSHACMAGCAIRCSNVYASQDGSEVLVSPMEYETMGLMGSNLLIDDLDAIAKMNWVVNDLGLDSIEVGAALGVAAEAGLFKFGDAQGALDLLEEIRQGTVTGRMLGNGAVMTGKVLGVRRVPAVKGQAMSAYEPRSIKGTGVTYATSPQGADHTCGLTIRAKINHLDPEGQVELSRNSQISMAGYDTIGACLFAGFGFAVSPGTIEKLVNARYDTDLPDGLLQRLGKETLILEREFNRRAGFTKQDDRLPEWMTQEPVPPHGAVFDVPDNELDNIFDWENIP